MIMVSLWLDERNKDRWWQLTEEMDRGVLIRWWEIINIGNSVCKLSFVKREEEAELVIF